MTKTASATETLSVNPPKSDAGSAPVRPTSRRSPEVVSPAANTSNNKMEIGEVTKLNANAPSRVTASDIYTIVGEGGDVVGISDSAALTSENFSEGRIEETSSPNSDPSANPSDNCLEGVILRKGDHFVIHPAAKRFRKITSHREKLRESLKQFGQKDDAVVRILEDGTVELVDGVTRGDELFAFEPPQPLRCRVLHKSELDGKTIEDWIMKANLHDGRDLNDAQRTVAALDVYSDEIAKWTGEAKVRQIGGTAVAANKKFDMAAFLAERVNVSKNKMEKTLLLSKKTDGTALLQAVWEGVPVSTAIKIADELDLDKKTILIAFAVKGDKKGLKVAMASCLETKAYDRFGVSIPESLLDTFEQTNVAESAIEKAKEAAEQLRNTDGSSGFSDEATRLKSQILPDLAYAMCDWCEWSGYVNGNPCPRCTGKRYLTLRAFEKAKEVEIEKHVIVVGR